MILAHSVNEPLRVDIRRLHVCASLRIVSIWFESTVPFDLSVQSVEFDQNTDTMDYSFMKNWRKYQYDKLLD